MKSFIACAAFAALASTPAVGQKKPRDSGCEPNPVFQAFPKAVPGKCEHSRFSRLDISQAKDPAHVSGAAARISKEGEYWYFLERLEADSGKYPGRVEIFRNYENALRQAGGTMLHADADRKFSYRVTRPSGEYWGEVGCATGSREACMQVSHKIVRIAAMEQSVVLSADQIRSSLADTGKVVFYGIYFDTDKAILKPESDPTLAEMARFLKANASTRVFIVGHTDMQGAVERNQRLSQERAAAVVAALAGKHGIAKDRLAADGVGPLAPVAANDAEAGRARNRRVEMVLR